MANPLVLIAIILVIVLIVAAVLLARRGSAGEASSTTDAIAVFDPGAASNSGKVSGTVTFHQARPSEPTLVKIDLSGLAPGDHGIHVHQYGNVSSGCTSACAHFNPQKQLHGSQSLYGTARHVGDLCNNITADANGNASFAYHDDLVALSGPNSVVGRSVVIHADPDDLGKFRGENTTQGIESGKTGNAGKRICCAVIGISGACRK